MVALIVTLAGFALGIASSLGLALIEWVAWVLVLPNRRQGVLTSQVDFMLDIHSPEHLLGEPIEAISFDSVKLTGLWHAANHPRDRQRGTVLLLHGFAEDPSGLRARMDALNARGWDVAALDARAHGRSEGDRGTFGARESRDVAVWIDTLTASGRIAPGSTTPAVWGRSMGSAIAVRTAAENPTRISALVLEAPYVDLEATFVHVLRRKRMPFSRLFGRLILRRAAKLAGEPLERPRPIDVAPEVRMPVLIVHGSADSLIGMDEVRTLAEAFPEPATVIEIPGGGHNTVVDVGGAPLLDRVATFLDQAVSGRDDGCRSDQATTGRTFIT